PAQLPRDLASLYFAGSITTTPDKAGTGSFGNLDVTAGSAADGAALRSAASQPGTPPRQPRALKVDPTAPAHLSRK
ncbi:MAG: hypothetical protein Q8L91_03695, partial [Polaromonas sp.]|nr:hypothetical protein [Polaromonas sp.]